MNLPRPVRKIAAGFGAAAFVVAGAAVIATVTRPSSSPGSIELVQPAANPTPAPADDPTTTATAAPPVAATEAAGPVTTTTAATGAPPVAVTTATTPPATTAGPVDDAPATVTTTTAPAPTTTTTTPCPDSSNVQISTGPGRWADPAARLIQPTANLTNRTEVPVVFDDVQLTITSTATGNDGQTEKTVTVVDGGHDVPVGPGQTITADIGTPTSSGAMSTIISKVVYHVDGRPDCITDSL